MTNYSFNGLNAHSVAQRIIDTEEAYLKIDPAALPFEDRLRYLIRHNGAYHPLSCIGVSAKVLFSELLLELGRRIRSGGSPNELFYYGMLSGEHEHSSPSIDAAVKAGSALACIYKADMIGREDPQFAYRLLKEALNMHKSGKEILDEESLYSCLTLLAAHATSSAARDRYRSAVDLMAEEKVLSGRYYPLAHLCIKDRSIYDVAGQEPYSEETLFWKTVDFLITEYVYKRSDGRRFADFLGFKLMLGHGCEPDIERAKQIYIDAMLSMPYDRERLLKLVGVPVIDGKECPEVVEYDCRRKISLGKVYVYWQMILLSLLANDRAGMEAACDAAIKQGSEAARRNIPKAYHMLRHASTDTEV